MPKDKDLRLYCFSPAVMLATFCIEIAAAIWVLIRYKFDRTAQLIVALLVCLSLFQLAEYMICEGAFGISSLDWSRLGYVATTLMPPLGVHLAQTIASRKSSSLLLAAYGSAALFAIFFLFVGHGMESPACLGNYVIFNIAPYALGAYTAYYYGWLVATVVLVWNYRSAVEDKDIRKALLGLAVGYAAFIIPTTFINLIDPTTIAGIPSIMCGFAVILAMILVLWVAPLVLKKR